MLPAVLRSRPPSAASAARRRPGGVSCQTERSHVTHACLLLEQTLTCAAERLSFTWMVERRSLQEDICRWSPASAGPTSPDCGQSFMYHLIVL